MGKEDEPDLISYQEIETVDKRFTLRVNVTLRDINFQPSLHSADNLILFLSKRYKKLRLT